MFVFGVVLSRRAKREARNRVNFYEQLRNKEYTDYMLAPRDLQPCLHNLHNKSRSEHSNSNSELEHSCSGDAAVRFKDVSFGHDSSSVLRDLSFTLPRGEVVSLLGPSGCGKTSVLRLIAGLERVVSGQIFLYEREVSARDEFIAPELRAGVGEIGMVFQDFALFPHLTARENLSLALSGCDERARLAREGSSEFSNGTLDISASRRARIDSILEMVELVDYGAKYPQELSGGQQQRVALARALVTSPRLLLLDEPFANLDVRLRDRIRDRTLHLLQSLRCSALLVTHDAEEGMYMANSLFVMDEQGCLVQSGSPRSVYGKPRDAFVASLLSEVNRFSVAIQDEHVSTPFGRYRAQFSNDGSSRASSWAEVVIRPQALSLSSADGSVNTSSDNSGGAGTAMGFVEAARMIGGYSLVHLSSCLPAHAVPQRNGSTGKLSVSKGGGKLSGGKGENKAGEALSIRDCEHDCLPVHLHARVAGCFLPSRGTRLRIAVDSSDVFIFEQKSSRSL